jgi:hypothetical protein
MISTDVKADFRVPLLSLVVIPVPGRGNSCITLGMDKNDILKIALTLGEIRGPPYSGFYPTLRRPCGSPLVREYQPYPTI